MPPAAVTGEDMRHNPKISRKAAKKYTSPISHCDVIISMIKTSSLFRLPGGGVMSFAPLGLRRAGLEHRQHPASNGIPARGIPRPQQHGDKTGRLFGHARGIEQADKSADHHNAMDEIRARH